MEAGGRHAVPGHERLGEGLAGFEACRRGRRAEQKPSVGREPVGDADAERELRPDDRQVDSFPRRKLGNCRRIGQADGMDGRNLGNPRISRGTEHRHAGIGSQAGDQRVLTPTATKYQNSHFFSDLHRTSWRPPAAGFGGDYFIDAVRDWP